MVKRTRLYDRSEAVAVTIALNQSLSAPVQLYGRGFFGVEMPSAWTAANLTFQVSTDGDTYRNLYDEDGNEVEVTAAANRFIRVFPADFMVFPYIRLRSGTAGVPVNQLAARTLNLLLW